MSRKVLSIDDSLVDQAHIKSILVQMGFSVVTAGSGAEGVAKAKSEKPEIIFLDVVMDGMDGYEACRVLRESPETKDIPVVFVTSKGQKVDKVWGQLQGGKGHVHKPATLENVSGELKLIGLA
jgi:twitching motility two-component system response regulator PilH